MKIVIIPDSFKGTLSSIEACDIIEKGIIKVMPFSQIIKIPIADGGEGTVDAFLEAAGGERMTAEVTSPVFERVEADYGILKDNTAIIEMAAASGLALAGENRNPLYTTTYGTGELIKAALDAGAKRIIIGIGGSATNDGGAGMAAALGARLLDKNGSAVSPVGGCLSLVEHIDMSGFDRRARETEIIAACDVENTLCGTNGASYVFAPQKGADENAVKILDANLKHFAGVIRRDIGIDVLEMKGGGAAGGLGAGLCAFCGASLMSGTDLLLEAAEFEKKAADADLIITGEGRFDFQSLYGKLPVGIFKRALGKKVALIAGKIDVDPEALIKYGITLFTASAAVGEPFEKIKKTCRADLETAAERIAMMFLEK